MPNKVYINPEASRSWSDTGTASDELLDLGGLAADAVACGSYHSWSTAARAAEVEFEVFIDGFDTAPVIGETVDLYVIESNDGTNFDGQPTTAPTDTAQGTVTENQLRNGKFVCSASVYNTTAANNLQARGVVEINAIYFAPVVHNNTADALLSSADAHKITARRIPREIQ